MTTQPHPEPSEEASSLPVVRRTHLDFWNDEHTSPTEPGWFVVRRADGTLCPRAFNHGLWWIPLKDGWLSGLPAGFSWFGPFAPVEWDTPHPASPEGSQHE